VVRIDPGAYLVVARNAARIGSTYGIANVVGDYAPNVLDDGGETIRLRNPEGITIEEVTYDDGGLWPRWADGYGPSLELIDLYGETNSPAAWDASDEASRSEWTNFQVTRAAAAGSGELHLPS
jgi:hypothetical protein